jgi:hypothetical protein
MGFDWGYATCQNNCHNLRYFPVQPLPSSVPPPAPSGGVSAGSWAETSGDGDEPEDIYEDTVAGALE